MAWSAAFNKLLLRAEPEEAPGDSGRESSPLVRGRAPSTPLRGHESTQQCKECVRGLGPACANVRCARQGAGSHQRDALLAHLRQVQVAPEDPDFLPRLCKVVKESGDTQALEFLAKNMDSMQDIGRRLWTLENAELQHLNKSRLDLTVEAARTPCCCEGLWKHAARERLATNGLDPAFWQCIYQALRDGRRKGNTVCLIGRYGNDGKSRLLRPQSSVPAVCLHFSNFQKLSIDLASKDSDAFGNIFCCKCLILQSASSHSPAVLWCPA